MNIVAWLIMNGVTLLIMNILLTYIGKYFLEAVKNAILIEIFLYGIAVARTVN